MSELVASRPFRATRHDYPVRDMHAVWASTDGAAYTWPATVRVVQFTTDGATAITATLPDVAAAAGLLFSAYLVTDGGVNVTITDNGDDTDFVDFVLGDVNDHVLLYCDGVHWFALVSGYIS